MLLMITALRVLGRLQQSQARLQPFAQDWYIRVMHVQLMAFQTCTSIKSMHTNATC